MEFLIYLSAPTQQIDMKGKDIKYNARDYNIFTICQEFRQRLEQLQRLKQKVLNEEVIK
jgi:phage-related tail protein